MIFHWSLSDSKSLQFSKTLLNILANLNNSVVWMVSTNPVISKSSSPFTNPLVTVPRTPITISINITFIFHSFFNSSARSWYLSFFSLSFNFTLLSAGTAKNTILQFLFLLLIIIRSGCLTDIRWSVCMSKPFGVCVSHSPGLMLGYAHISFVCMVKFKLLAQFMLTQSSIIILFYSYSFLLIGFIPYLSVIF